MATQIVTPNLNQHGVPPCPECGRFDFRRKTAWGIHRMRKHGIAGTSKTSLANRQAQDQRSGKHSQSKRNPPTIPAIVKTNPARNGHRSGASASDNPLQCPHCPETLKSPAALGRHLRFKHGVPGKTAQKHLGSGQQHQFNNPFQEIHNERSSSLAKTRSHSSTEKEETLSRHEGLVLYVVGQIQQLCRSIAEQEDIPSREFTHRCAEFISHQTSR